MGKRERRGGAERWSGEMDRRVECESLKSMNGSESRMSNDIHDMKIRPPFPDLKPIFWSRDD